MGQIDDDVGAGIRFGRIVVGLEHRDACGSGVFGTIRIGKGELERVVSGLS